MPAQKRMLPWLGQNVERIGKVAFGINAILLFFLMIFMSAEVIGRYLLARPIGWTFEVSEYILVAVTFLSLSYIQAQDGHLKISLVTSKLSEKRQIQLSIVTSILSFMFCLLIVWGSWEISWNSLRLGLRSETQYNLPLWIYQSLVPIGCLLFCSQCLVNIGRRIQHLGSHVGPEQIVAPSL